MSSLSGLVKASAVGVLGQLEDVFLKSSSAIGYVIPQVVIAEHHRDEAVISDHPIDNGSPVTDHVYLRPAELTMVIGWSNSASIFDASGTLNNADDAYPVLLDMMATRDRFNVTTSKRTYSDMVIASLDTITDKETNNVLRIEVGLRQVFIVDVSSTTLSTTATQAEPAKTAPTVDAGTKQTVAPQQSALKGISSYLSGLLGS